MHAQAHTLSLKGRPVSKFPSPIYDSYYQDSITNNITD